MAFAIEVVGTLEGALRCCLVDLVGEEALAQGAGTIVVSVPDQAALIPVLLRLHDLGIEVERIQRA